MNGSCSGGREESSCVFLASEPRARRSTFSPPSQCFAPTPTRPSMDAQGFSPRLDVGHTWGRCWTLPYSRLTLREPAHQLSLERRLQKPGQHVKSVKTKDNFLKEHLKAERGWRETSGVRGPGCAGERAIPRLDPSHGTSRVKGLVSCRHNFQTPVSNSDDSP